MRAHADSSELSQVNTPMVPAADPLPLPVRAAIEGAAGTSVSLVTLVLTDQMTALIVTVLIAAIGGIVWLVRLEGQIKAQAQALEFQKQLIEAQDARLTTLDGKLDRLLARHGR